MNNFIYKECYIAITWDDLYDCKNLSGSYTGSAVECEVLGQRAVVDLKDFSEHGDVDDCFDRTNFEAEVSTNLSYLAYKEFVFPNT